MNINKIYCEDFKIGQSLVEDNSVDLVFTDPPYPKKYIQPALAPHL